MKNGINLLKPKLKYPKSKKRSVSKLKKELERIVKAQVKKRDNYTCQRCGKYVEGSECQASHVIPVSHGNALAFDPLNMKVLCTHCHLHWWHKNPIKAAEWFKERFPERYQYLELHYNDKVHWKAHDYQQMIDEMSLP